LASLTEAETNNRGNKENKTGKVSQSTGKTPFTVFCDPQIEKKGKKQTAKDKTVKPTVSSSGVQTELQWTDDHFHIHAGSCNTRYTIEGSNCVITLQFILSALLQECVLKWNIFLSSIFSA